MPTATGRPWETVVEGAQGAPSLAVRVRTGAGTPLVLLHGLGGTLEEWEPVAELLTPHHPVYAFDQRGHGRSGDAAWSIEGQVEDLARVVDRFGLRAPVVVGYDLGGVVATLYATRPADLTAAVSIDGYGWPTAAVVAERLGLSPQDAAANAATARAFAIDQMAAVTSPMPAEVFERRLDSYRGDPFELPGAVLAATVLRSALREGPLVFPRPGPRGVRALYAELEAYDMDTLLPDLRVPALALVTQRPLPPIAGAPARFSAMMAAQAAHELSAHTRHRASAGLDVPRPAHLSRPSAVAQAIENFVAGLVA